MIIMVTGTGTDVGKTIATAALVSVLRDRGIDVLPAKPVQTGPGEGDVATIAALTGVPGVEYARYPEPLAPNIAARRAGQRQVTREELGVWLRGLEASGRTVLVEGAGGLLVRLADDLTLADLAADVGAPLLVVTSLGLGSLNAAELTVRAARARGLEVIGLIGGSLPAEPDLATRENLTELPRVTGVPLLGCLPAGHSGTCLEELQDFLRELAVGVDADVRLGRVVACADSAALPHRAQADLLEDTGRGRVVGGDARGDRGVRVHALGGLEGGLGNLGGETVAPLVGAEAVLEVPDAAVDELDATDPDELGGLVAHVDAPRSEVLGGPGGLGAADELVGLLDGLVTRLRAVLPDALVAVDLVGLGVVLGAQGHEDESFSACDRSHGEMLHTSHSLVCVFRQIFQGAYGRTPLCPGRPDSRDAGGSRGTRQRGLPRLAAMNPMMTVEELRALRDAVVLCASMGPTPPTHGIPGSHLADLEGDFSDSSSDLPHTVPADVQALFESYGVSDDTPVVVYDDAAGATAPRVWWLAKVAGIEARVLDGGLAAWREAGGELAPFAAPRGGGHLSAQPRPELLRNRADVEQDGRLVVDARSAGRFAGSEPEPRPGLRSGHIPGSVNLPYTEVYRDGHLRPAAELKALFADVAGERRDLTFSCGSGVTACVDALAATVAGYEDLAVYEGSWSEWGRE